MAWFDWLTGKKALPTLDKGGGLFHSASSHPSNASRSGMSAKAGSGPSQPAASASSQRLEQRRTERNTKRELLFQVVREAMVRVGVLSSAFKFKVLSLDQRGRSFLVMIELSAEFSGEVEKLAEIESMIAQTAKHRYELIVQAVYWRYFNVVGAGASGSSAPLLGAQHAPISRPAPLFGLDNAAAHLKLAPAPESHARPVGSSQALAAQTPKAAMPPGTQTPSPAPNPAVHDALGDDEVQAFRRALAAGASQGALSAPAAANELPLPDTAQTSVPNKLEKARSKLLLTGYEDTEMVDDDPLPVLSGTQYGELR